ncbi:sensor histidine kinase [Amantichitinum ursilacus]|uniref:histidine kinase n=1 Tax=Amantichitinum ursilacus TaxID=857265 RepID=A0A0N0XIF8_9NEIS|nr:ATP-binding protein [Amantichitinum ursilacus]KPC52867.1 Sensor protein ZraS [Amantichitinum ursilacus]
MHSIRSRLNLLVLAIVTTVLSISGIVSWFQSRDNAELQFGLMAQSLQSRLQTVLPGILWNFDEAQLQRVLDAEMQSTDLAYVGVQTTEGLQAVRRRDGSLVVDHGLPDDNDGISRDFSLNYHSNDGDHPIGKVHVVLTRQRITDRLNRLIVTKLIEILVLDTIMVLALMTSYSRVLLRPLSALRNALNRAADTPAFSLNDLRLPGRRDDEVGQVADGVERIARRLLTELEERKAAEIAIRQAKERTDEAYRVLKDTQASLVQAEKMASLGGLVAGVAHEINTPVGVILTSASVLAEETATFNANVESGSVRKSDLLRYTETAGQSAQLILSNAGRAAELIHSFKQVAVDQTSEARRAFGLCEYLHEVITSLSPKLKRTAIEVQLECPEHIRMDGYPGALSQVFTNFVTNALTHAFDEGAAGLITINVTADGPDHAVLQFRDNGKGIAPEHLGRIFDPFYTTRRGSGGSGLGLNVVYNLVTQTLGGVIDVQSTLGQGTTFTLRLPLTVA